MQHDALLPRPPDGLAPGAALALLVHGGLIVALTLGVNWRMTSPEVVSAELWAAVPQVAAPRVEEPPAPVPAPAPPPPKPAPPPAQAAPTEAQIATERAERKRIEKDKKDEAAKPKPKPVDPEIEKKRLADELKREADELKAEELRLAKTREEQLKRMMSGLPATGPATSTGTASRDAAPSQAYVGRLVRMIRNNWTLTGAINDKLAADVEVTSAAGGSIIARRIVKSSGNPDYDDSVLRAIDKTRALPPDENGRVPQSLIITFRPKE